jgi:hypothetical protein
MSIQYVPPVPQESYQQVGIVSSIVGFFILAYFFMYSPSHAAIRAPSSPRTGRSSSS